jgi:hypothetical protein
LGQDESQSLGLDNGDHGLDTDEVKIAWRHSEHIAAGLPLRLQRRQQCLQVALAADPYTPFCPGVRVRTNVTRSSPGPS